MVRFQGLTVAALGVMLSAQAQGSSGEHRGPMSPPPPLLDSVSADSLVPRGPEPVMDRVVANELPNSRMEACGVVHIPPASSATVHRGVLIHAGGLRQPLEISLGKNWYSNLPRCTINLSSNQLYICCYIIISAVAQEAERVTVHLLFTCQSGLGQDTEPQIAPDDQASTLHRCVPSLCA